MRVDISNGKRYNDYNIPLNDDFKIYKGYNKKTNTKYMIIAENPTEDCWYNGKFIGTRYAVFELNKRGNFYQQVTKWYKLYRYCYRHLLHFIGFYDDVIEKDNI